MSVSESLGGLVLSRKVGQSIMIGDNISVSVSEIRGNIIRLRIEAPKNITILRNELTENKGNE